MLTKRNHITANRPKKLVVSNTESVDEIAEVEKAEEQETIMTKTEEEGILTSDVVEDDFPSLDVDKIEAIEHPTRSAASGSSEASVVRIINTEKSGKRIVLKKEVIEKLDLDETIQAGLQDNVVILAKAGIADKIEYNLKEYGKSFAVYNSKLVEDITEALELDFSEVTSIGLEVKFIANDGQMYLMAKNPSDSSYN